MERSGMWGYKDDDTKGVLKERYKYKMQRILFGRSFRTFWQPLAKPHIPFHAGLKSSIPSELDC
ncbi:hypothetical protein Barb7_00707 [Bacteroidales bacterium Barb7]|nr:hypothetical protein Barb7_00707 [Bacteroidales bacterium Barb7]